MVEAEFTEGFGIYRGLDQESESWTRVLPVAMEGHKQFSPGEDMDALMRCASISPLN